MALICKGTQARFKLASGKWVAPRGALLHDPDGRSWPECSGLVMPFKRTGEAPSREYDQARHYLGRSYEIKQGRIDKLPPRALSEWEEIGEVTRAEYHRGGTKAPGDYFHPMGARQWFRLFIKPDLPVLYRYGNIYRLELGKGCHWSDRGLIVP
jgi:hypothetical protein